jgi:hypothetical protein
MLSYDRYVKKREVLGNLLGTLLKNKKWKNKSYKKVENNSENIIFCS